MDNREKLPASASLQECQMWGSLHTEYVYIPDDANVQKNALYVSGIPASMQTQEQIFKLFEKYGVSHVAFHKLHQADWSKVKLTFDDEKSALKAYKDMNVEVPLEESFRVEWWRNFDGTENVETEKRNDTKCETRYVQPSNKYFEALVSEVKNCLSSRPPTSRRLLARDFCGLSGHLPDMPVGQEVRTRDIHLRILQGRVYGPPPATDDTADHYAPRHLIGSNRNGINQRSEELNSMLILRGGRNVCHVCDTVTSNEPCCYCRGPVYCRSECAYEHLNEHMRRCTFLNSSPSDTPSRSADNLQSEAQFANFDSNSDDGRDTQRGSGSNDWERASSDANVEERIRRSNDTTCGDRRERDKMGICEGSDGASDREGGLMINQREKKAASVRDFSTRRGFSKGDRLEVEIRSRTGPTVYWVTNDADSEQMNEMNEKMDEAYSRKARVVAKERHIDDCVAAKYDQRWFRGQIGSKRGDTLVVFLVDVGTNAHLDACDVADLDDAWIRAPPYAFRMKLLDASGERCKNMERGERVTVTIVSGLDENIVEAVVLTDEASEWNANEASGDAPSSRMHLVTLNVPIPFYVLAPCVDEGTTNAYWVILQSDNRALDRLNDELAACPLTSVDQLTVASLVVAPFGNDGWFRCQVRRIGDDHVKVFFVDYGNERRVQRADLRALPQQLRQQLPFAMKVKLPKNCPPEFRNMKYGDGITLIIKSKNEDWLEAEIAREDD